MALLGQRGSLAAILHNKIVVLHLQQYLSFVDLLCLQKACRRLVPCLEQYVPSLREVITQSLPTLGSFWPELWKFLPAVGAALHGSFLLHCLLRPLGHSAYSQIFAPTSDLDLLEPAQRKQSSALPQFLKDYCQKYSMLESREGSQYLQRTVFRLAGGEPDIDHVTFDLPQQEICVFNPETFCHERRRPTVFDWLREGVDLPFSKIAYDGRTLFVGDLRALQQRSAPLPREYEDFDRYIYHRVSNYLRKGFQITMSERALGNFQHYQQQYSKEVPRVCTDAY